jgi:hypothetical protein
MEIRERVNCIVGVGSASELNKFGWKMSEKRRVSALCPFRVRFQLDSILHQLTILSVSIYSCYFKLRHEVLVIQHQHNCNR